MTSIRRFHKIVGLVLLLPFLGWIVTALVFYFKPGYAGAYAMLQPKMYPMKSQMELRADSTWIEFRMCRTILGDHLLVKKTEGWMQLDPSTGLERVIPGESDLRRLVTDASSVDSARYGEIVEVSGGTITTSTGVRIEIDWNRLSLYQRGKDTDFIDRLYSIHYLQWTGIGMVDKILGPLGLGLLLVLAILGIRLAVGGRNSG